MRRLLLLVAAAALGFVALTQVAPPPTSAPDFGASDVTLPDGAVPSPSAWYCPWVEAGDVVDTDVVVASESDADGTITLLDPIANAEPSTGEFSLFGPGATAISTGSILRVGESPAIVEISNGPASASAIEFADSFVAGDRCVVSVPKIWYLTGGSTKTGTITELRLFNPFADAATVTVAAYSELNLDLVQELDGLDVAGRGWTTIDIGTYLPFRDELAFTIETTRGLVIPAIIRIDDRGEAMWPGVAPNDTWEFPITTTGELEPFIAVMSAGDDGIVVSIDIVTEGGIVRGAREIVLDSSAPALVPISDLAAAPYGVRVTATAPIAASVIAVVPEEDVEGGEGEDPDATTTTVADETSTTVEGEPVFVRGMAGTVGSVRAASSWIVPIDTLPGSTTTLWLMNTGVDPASVSYRPLGEIEYDADEAVEVPAESIVGVPVDVGIGVYGFKVEADLPITVAWELHGDRGAMLVSGIPSQ